MSTEDTSLSQDEVFDLLSSARRRYVIYVLRTRSEPMEVTDLAEEVAAWENDTTIDELSSQERKRVYVSLYQTHIPKLASAGVVDYDRDTGLVELTRKTGQMDRYLQTPQPDRVPWQYIYAPIAVVSAALFGLTLLDVWLFAGVDSMVMSIVLTLVLGGVVVAHLAYIRLQESAVPPELERTE